MPPGEKAAVMDEAQARLLKLVGDSGPEFKKQMRDLLGVNNNAITRKKRRGSNADARQKVARFGEVVQPEGFQVVPPQGVYERGPLAVQAWREKRDEGMGITDSELDDIVNAAVM